MTKAKATFVLLLALVGLVVLPAAAHAKMNGGCTATATASKSGAVDLTQASTWHVKDADVLSGRASASTPQSFAQLRVLIFGIGLPLLDQTGSSPSGFAGPYRISDYDRYTRVLSVGGTSSTCDGSIMIVVDDVAPLATWAGIVGLVATVLGLIGLIASLFQFPNGSARIVSAVVGVVAGLGLGLLFQEFALLDPGNVLGLLLPAGGALVGLIATGLAYREVVARPSGVAEHPKIQTT